MCGIVGFMTKETTKLEIDRSKFLRQALVIDTLRGDDSCGIFAVGHEPLYEEGGAYWLKQLGTGAEFIETEDYKENVKDTRDYRCVVGHNRAATVGGVSADTAHPFQVGPITLVHNGTLRSTASLPEPMGTIKLGKKKYCEVDSLAIAHNLAHHDTEEVLSKLNGAFAMVWHDDRDDSINVIRNDERPLHMAMSNQQDTVYFMSEAEMLWLLDRRLKLGLKQIYYPKPGQWLKWTKDAPLDSPHVTEIDLYEPKYYHNSCRSSPYNGYGTGWDWDDWEDSYEGFHWRSQSNRSAENSKSGKGYGLRGDSNKVYVGGRMQEVPEACQETLLKYDLLVEDRLPFVPLSSRRTGKKLTVTGTLDGKYKAILYSQTQASGNLMSQTWLVRPVAIKVNGSGEPCVITRLVATHYNVAARRSSTSPNIPATQRKVGSTISDSGIDPNPNRVGDEPLCEWVQKEDGEETRYCMMEGGIIWERRETGRYWKKSDWEAGDFADSKFPLDKADLDEGEDTDAEDESYYDRLDRLRRENGMVTGPFGVKITAHEFVKLTEHGCAVCGSTITLDEADRLVWSIDGTDPICQWCDEEDYYAVYGGRRMYH